MKLLNKFVGITSITFISRICGYIRDMMLASYLGLSILNDIFLAAFRVSNMLRVVFGDGVMQISFLSLFKGIEKAEEKCFIDKIYTLLNILLFLISVIFLLFMDTVMESITPGFQNDSKSLSVTIECARIMFLYIFFISISAFYGTILSIQKKYYMYSFTSVILNLILICSIYFFSDKYHDGYSPVYLLSYTVLFSGFVEFLWMLYGIKDSHLKPKLTFISYDKDIKAFFSKSLIVMISASGQQINILLSMMVASYFHGAISSIYFADRIIQLPVALIGVTFSTLITSTISSNKSVNKNEDFDIWILFSMMLSIPSFVGIFLMAENLLSLLFLSNYGAVKTTSSILRILSFSIPTFILNKIINSFFFGNGNTTIPTVGVIFSVIIQFISIFLFLNKYNYLAIGLGVTISSFFNTLFLIAVISTKRYNEFKNIYSKIKDFIFECLKYFFSSIVMGFSIIYFNTLCHFSLVLQIISCILIGATIYFISLYFLSSSMFKQIFVYFYARKTK